MFERIRYISLLMGIILFASCGGDETPNPADSFNRREVIERLADDLILPSYNDFRTSVGDLKSAFDSYRTSPGTPELEALKSAWIEAYLSWQEAALWNFGPAEQTGLLAAMNIYPLDTAQVRLNLSGSYDLNSISQFDAQGFPALEYLLYSNNINRSDASVSQYFADVLDRMIAKTDQTISLWEQSYYAEFTTADGTDRGSALGELFNTTFLPYLEVHQREAKFGIPGGQRTGQPAPSKVEGYFSRNFSGQLALRAFEAYRRAWLGSGHINHDAGPSVIDYVEYMDNRNGTGLSDKLQGQLSDIQLAIEGLDGDFHNIAQSNPQYLNDVWAKYQTMVFTIKTEVSSSLNVTISYVDSDGD